MFYRWRVILLSLVLLIVIAGLIFTTTPYGVVSLFLLGVKQTFPYEEAQFESFMRTKDGSTLISNLDMAGFTDDADASIRIQRLLIQEFTPFGVSAVVEQGRFFSPDIPDPVFFEGSLIQDKVNAYGYTRGIQLETFWKMFKIDGLHLKGDVENIDFNVAGDTTQLYVTGQCFLSSFSSMSFDVQNAAVNLRLYFDRVGQSFTPSGEILLEGGTAITRGREFQLNKAKIVLRGDKKPPMLNILAKKIVGKVTIYLNIVGTKDHMRVRLTSTPPLSEDQLWELIALGAGAAPDNNDGRLEGKVPINSRFSVTVDRKVEQDKGVGTVETETPQPPEDRIMLEFKSPF